MAIPAPPPGFTEDVQQPAVAPAMPVAPSLPAAPAGFTEDVDPTGQSYLAGLARSVGQGALFGFSDEAVARLRQLSGEEYEKALADEREKLKAFKKANPKTAIAAELGGGFLTPGLGLAGGVIRPAASLAGRMVQGATLGTGFGAVSGAGTADENRLEGAKRGAIAGAAIGSALPVAGAVASSGVNLVRDIASPTAARMRSGIDAAADQVLVNKLRREGKTPQAVAADLATGQQAAALPKSTASLPETIMDATPGMQRLGGSVYRAGNEAGDVVQEFVASRQGGDPAKGLFGKASSRAVPMNQFERLVDDFKRAFGVKSKELDKELTTIRSEQKTLGNQDYAKAFKQQDAVDLENTLTAWALKAQDEPGKVEQAAIRDAVRLFANPKGFAANNLERIDKAKRSLDGAIGVADRAGNNNLVRLLSEFKRDVLERVHLPDSSGAPTLNKAYAEARQAWGSRAELMNAAESGRKFMRGSSDVTVGDFKGMTKAEQNMFRLGVVNELQTMLGGKALGPTADFTRLLYQPNVYSRLREVIPQGATSDRINTLVSREKRISETAKEVLGNSKTAQRGQDDVEFAGRDVLGSAYQAFRSQGGMINLGLDAMKVAAEKAFGFRDDMASALAKRLTESDPATQQAILARLAARMGASKVDKFLDAAGYVGAASTAAVPGATGRPLGETAR